MEVFAKASCAETWKKANIQDHKSLSNDCHASLLPCAAAPIFHSSAGNPCDQPKRREYLFQCHVVMTAICSLSLICRDCNSGFPALKSAGMLFPSSATAFHVAGAPQPAIHSSLNGIFISGKQLHSPCSKGEACA